MSKILGYILKLLGVFMIVFLLTGYGFYTYLFERDHKYYEVEDPEVKVNLDKGSKTFQKCTSKYVGLWKIGMGESKWRSLVAVWKIIAYSQQTHSGYALTNDVFLKNVSEGSLEKDPS